MNGYGKDMKKMNKKNTLRMGGLVYRTAETSIAMSAFIEEIAAQRFQETCESLQKEIEKTVLPYGRK